MTHSKSKIQNPKLSFPRYPRYKDSGIEWLGEVPEHWEIAPFQGLFEMSPEKNGKSIVGEMLSISGYRGVEPKQYESDSQKRTSEQLADYRVVRKGQLAVNTMWLNYAGLGVSEFEGHMSPAYRAYSIRLKLNRRYAHHLLRSSLYVEACTGLMQDIRPNSLQIKNEDFKKIPVLVPPKPEQDRIVAFLDRKTAEIDALIAKKQRQIELLEEQKAILINRAVTRGLNPNAKLKPSGIEWIGEIPVHWEVLRVKHQAIYFTSGSRGWGDFYSDEGDLFLQSGDLTNNCSISLTNAKRVKLPRKAEGLRTRLQTNDTVVCITGANTGRVANVGAISETIYVNQHLCLVRPSKEIDHRYLSLALSGSAGRTHFSLCQYGFEGGTESR